MKSFGLWYKKKEDNKEVKDPEISLHVNFWSLEDIPNSKGVKQPYLDIGIKIKDYKELEEVVFHCPFVVEQDNVEDLSKKLETKSNANIIFNEDCEIETKDSYTIVKLEGGEEPLLILPLSQAGENIFSIEKLDRLDKSNIIFEFTDFLKYVGSIPQLNTIEELYIRFRIKSITLKDKIYFDSELLNKSFESAFSGTRIIDFKVNEKRNIDDEVKTKIVVKKQEWAKLKRIHFLVMEPSSYDLISFTSDEMKCRELEESLWDDYLDTTIDFKKGHVLAYHWQGEGDFSYLVKVKYSKARISTIVSYIFIVIALGIISSTVVTAVWEMLKSQGTSISVLGNMVVAMIVLIVGIFSDKKSG